MTNHRKLLTATNILILITVLMYFVQISIPNGGLWLGLNIFFLQEKLYYQVLSTMFAHGGIEHLLMNMLVLWQFGNLLEGYLGKVKFLFIYLLGGIATSLLTFLYMYSFNDYANIVGASGAISVLFGFVALKDKAQRKGIIILILLISFVPMLFGYNIAWHAHLIGFCIGWFVGYII
jgi:rhomboid protease GluP